MCKGVKEITNNKTGVEIGGPSGTGTIIYQNATNMDNVIFSNNTIWSNHTDEYNIYDYLGVRYVVYNEKKVNNRYIDI